MFSLIVQFEGYKFDPNGEYVRRWLPELARLPTEWIHHPWNAPESVLQAAGIELGSNYPLRIIEMDAAKARLEEALSTMWQQEAALQNGLEEGLGDSSELAPIAFPQDIQMEVDHEPIRNNNNNQTALARHYQDQMVPSITSSLVRVEEEEASSDIRNSAENSRAEVPTNVNLNINQGLLNERDIRFSNAFPLSAEDSTADSSSSSGSRRERDGGVVPVWSPSSTSYPTEQFVGEENAIGTNSTYLQSHQLMSWRRLSQTG